MPAPRRSCCPAMDSRHSSPSASTRAHTANHRFGTSTVSRSTRAGASRLGVGGPGGRSGRPGRKLDSGLHGAQGSSVNSRRTRTVGRCSDRCVDSRPVPRTRRDRSALPAALTPLERRAPGGSPGLLRKQALRHRSRRPAPVRSTPRLAGFTSSAHPRRRCPGRSSPPSPSPLAASLPTSLKVRCRRLDIVRRRNVP